MTFQLKKKLKNRIATALNEKAKVHIGKNGLTPDIYTEINNQLAIHELIKVRFLNNYLTEDINQDINLISEKRVGFVGSPFPFILKNFALLGASNGITNTVFHSITFPFESFSEVAPIMFIPAGT